MHGADARVQAYYRLIECKDDELCGCGSETRRYAECCKSSDLQLNLAEIAPMFLRTASGGFQTRSPPRSVIDFIEGRATLPRLQDIHVHRS
jgi:hypothetical protein